MKNLKPVGPHAGSRILVSLQEAVDWVVGKDVAVRVTTVPVPVISLLGSASFTLIHLSLYAQE